MYIRERGAQVVPETGVFRDTGTRACQSNPRSLSSLGRRSRLRVLRACLVSERVLRNTKRPSIPLLSPYGGPTNCDSDDLATY